MSVPHAPSGRRALTPADVCAAIAKAKRFDRTIFEDDTALVDWAQSLCRHAVESLSEVDAALKATGENRG